MSTAGGVNNLADDLDGPASNCNMMISENAKIRIPFQRLMKRLISSTTSLNSIRKAIDLESMNQSADAPSNELELLLELMRKEICDQEEWKVFSEGLRIAVSVFYNQVGSSVRAYWSVGERLSEDKHYRVLSGLHLMLAAAQYEPISVEAFNIGGAACCGIEVKAPVTARWEGLDSRPFHQWVADRQLYDIGQPEEDDGDGNGDYDEDDDLPLHFSFSRPSKGGAFWGGIGDDYPIPRADDKGEAYRRENNEQESEQTAQHKERKAMISHDSIPANRPTLSEIEADYITYSDFSRYALLYTSGVRQRPVAGLFLREKLSILLGQLFVALWLRVPQSVKKWLPCSWSLLLPTAAANLELRWRLRKNVAEEHGGQGGRRKQWASDSMRLSDYLSPKSFLEPKEMEAFKQIQTERPPSTVFEAFLAAALTGSAPPTLRAKSSLRRHSNKDDNDRVVSTGDKFSPQTNSATELAKHSRGLSKGITPFSPSFSSSAHMRVKRKSSRLLLKVNGVDDDCRNANNNANKINGVGGAVSDSDGQSLWVHFAIWLLCLSAPLLKLCTDGFLRITLPFVELFVFPFLIEMCTPELVAEAKHRAREAGPSTSAKGGTATARDLGAGATLFSHRKETLLSKKGDHFKVDDHSIKNVRTHKGILKKAAFLSNSIVSAVTPKIASVIISAAATRALAIGKGSRRIFTSSSRNVITPESTRKTVLEEPRSAVGSVDTAAAHCKSQESTPRLSACSSGVVSSTQSSLGWTICKSSHSERKGNKDGKDEPAAKGGQVPCADAGGASDILAFRKKLGDNVDPILDKDNDTAAGRLDALTTRLVKSPVLLDSSLSTEDTIVSLSSAPPSVEREHDGAVDLASQNSLLCVQEEAEERKPNPRSKHLRAHTLEYMDDSFGEAVGDGLSRGDAPSKAERQASEPEVKNNSPSQARAGINPPDFMRRRRRSSSAAVGASLMQRVEATSSSPNATKKSTAGDSSSCAAPLSVAVSGAKGTTGQQHQQEQQSASSPNVPPLCPLRSAGINRPAQQQRRLSLTLDDRIGTMTTLGGDSSNNTIVMLDAADSSLSPAHDDWEGMMGGDGHTLFLARNLSEFGVGAGGVSASGGNSPPGQGFKMKDSSPNPSRPFSLSEPNHHAAQQPQQQQHITLNDLKRARRSVADYVEELEGRHDPTLAVGSIRGEKGFPKESSQQNFPENNNNNNLISNIVPLATAPTGKAITGALPPIMTTFAPEVATSGIPTSSPKCGYSSVPSHQPQLQQQMPTTASSPHLGIRKVLDRYSLDNFLADNGGWAALFKGAVLRELYYDSVVVIYRPSVNSNGLIPNAAERERSGDNSNRSKWNANSPQSTQSSRSSVIRMREFTNVPIGDVEALLPNLDVELPPSDRVTFWAQSVLIGILLLIFLWELLRFFFSHGGNTFPHSSSDGHTKRFPERYSQLLTSLVMILALSYRLYSVIIGHESAKMHYLREIAQWKEEKRAGNDDAVLSKLCTNVSMQEAKEMLLAYFFLWRLGPMNAIDLQQCVHNFLKTEFEIDNFCFDIVDALLKLGSAGLVRDQPRAEHQLRAQEAFEKEAERIRKKHREEWERNNSGNQKGEGDVTENPSFHRFGGADGVRPVSGGVSSVGDSTSLGAKAGHRDTIFEIAMTPAEWCAAHPLAHLSTINLGHSTKKK